MATAAAPIKPNPFAIVREKVSAILLSPEAKSHIAPYLHHGVSLERVVSTIHQVVAENEELLECTPTSLIMAVSKGVNWDLEFGETVHLVPFNVNVAKRDQAPKWEKRAQAIRDYKGDIELVIRSGAARAVEAQCFYEKEILKYEQGTNPFIEHHPIVDVRKRGPMLGAYAWARISVHSLKITVMSVDEIDAIRQEKSKSWKKGPLPDWYACKTVVHRVTRSLPKNKRLAAVLKEFEKEEEEIPEGEFEVVAADVGTSTPTASDGAATGPAAAAASDDDTPALISVEDPDLSTLTLEQAKQLPLLGPPGAWGGKVGEPLDSFAIANLQTIKSWCISQIEKNGDDPEKQLAITAITLILIDREEKRAAKAAGR